jgi:hypothetical protein
MTSFHSFRATFSVTKTHMQCSLVAPKKLFPFSNNAVQHSSFADTVVTLVFLTVVVSAQSALHPYGNYTLLHFHHGMGLHIAAVSRTAMGWVLLFASYFSTR